MSEDRFVDGHYVVTTADAYIAHIRICRPNENPEVLMPDQLEGTLGRPYCGYYPELYEKAAVLMHGLAGLQVFRTISALRLRWLTF
jgi:hypothetical protein